MKIFRRACVLMLLAAIIQTPTNAQSPTEIPSPESVLGFTPGSDRQLADYGQLVGYMERLAEASPRVEMRDVGQTPQHQTNGAHHRKHSHDSSSDDDSDDDSDGESHHKKSHHKKSHHKKAHHKKKSHHAKP